MAWTILLTGGIALARTSQVSARPDPRAWSPAQRALAATPTEVPACTFDVDKVAYPRDVELGSAVTISLAVKPVCRSSYLQLHVVLVLDASSKPPQLAAKMRQKAVDLVDRLDLYNHRLTKVGVVQFNASAETLCQLTANVARAKACISRVDAVGGTRLDLGILEGVTVLRNGRNRISDRAQILEVLVFFVEDGNDTGCGPVLQAARGAKVAGILVIGVCVGTECDPICPRQAATSARYFFEWKDVDSVAPTLYGTYGSPGRAHMVITDTLPANMNYVPGSSEPAAVDSPPHLVWSFADQFAADVYTMTFQVLPQEHGRHPTNLSAVGRLVRRTVGEDTFTFTFPIPEVIVRDPATGTPPPPPATPTPVATITATATASRLLHPVYLPIVRDR